MEQTAGRALLQLLRPDRDERLHVVRGAAHRGRAPGRICRSGEPIDGVAILVVDEAGEPVPARDAGRVARPRADRDARDISASPIRRRRCSSTQRDGTGSTAPVTSFEYGEDGNLRFLGRRDAQVKSRGYRIELGEIERTLYALEAGHRVRRPRDPRRARHEQAEGVIAAYGRLSEQGCRQLLPASGCRDIWFPDEIEFRDALPKSSTGKIDRQKLAS